MPIGFIRLAADQITRTLPLGSQIEFTLAVDASQLLLASAYIPILDKRIEGSIDLIRPDVDLPVLDQEIAAELERFNTTFAQYERGGVEEIDEIFDEITDGQRIENLTADLNSIAAGHSEETAPNHLRDLRVRLDESEGLQQWPALELEAQDSLTDAINACESDFANEHDTLWLQEASSQLSIRRQSRDVDSLRRIIAELDDIYWTIRRQSPTHWAELFGRLQTDHWQQFQDSSLADQLLQQGQRCVEEDDVDGLKAVCQQLIRLLPQDEDNSLGSGYGSTIVR